MKYIGDEILRNTVSELRDAEELSEIEQLEGIQWLCLKCRSESYDFRCPDCKTDEYSVLFPSSRSQFSELHDVSEMTNNILRAVLSEVDNKGN